jgi:hypothetical protein
LSRARLLKCPVRRCLPSCLLHRLFGRLQCRTARLLFGCLPLNSFRGLLRRAVCRLLGGLLCRQFQLMCRLLP